MVTDSELLMLINEGNEDAKKLLVNKYIPAINYIIGRHKRHLKYLGIDEYEVYYEGIKAIEISIINYDERKETSFKTYVNIVIESKIKQLIKRYSSNNQILLNNAIINNHLMEEKGLYLGDISIDYKSNPEVRIYNEELAKEQLDVIKNILSKMEYQVFRYMLNNLSRKEIAKVMQKDIKDIYNAINRIKCKLQKIMDKNT